MITTITTPTRPRRALPFVAALVLAAPAACADDDSSATSEGSSSSSGGGSDPSTTGTAPGSTTAADTGTGASTTAADTGTEASATADTGTTDGGTASDGSSSGSTGIGALEIAGEWLEEFAPGMGITHAIDEARWDQLSDFGDAAFHVDSYDNEARFVVAQADAANEFSPGLWSRFDWVWDGDALYYCTAVYDARTAEDALAAPASEPGDLETGCGGFPWSTLVPVR